MNWKEAPEDKIMDRQEQIEQEALKRTELPHFEGLDGKYKTAYMLGFTAGANWATQNLDHERK